jgi:Tol biopolymer transport system component/DNA-binding winged helix-turn-helix (wHTH) protein
MHNRYRFGAYDFDSSSGELCKNGLRLRFGGQVSQILHALLSSPGEIVTREELRTLLWPDGIHVDFEHNLNKAVNRLREILGDSAGAPRFIETVPKRGYRFVAPVLKIDEQDRPAPRLIQPAAGMREGSRRWIVPAIAILTVAGIGLAILAMQKRSSGELLAPIPVTSLPGRETSASQSPDGRQMVFVWDGSAGDNLDIYRMEIGQQNPTRLTDHPARDYSPRWSPDGRQIAFMREIDPRTALVLVMPAEGGTPRQIGSVASPPQGYTSHAIPRRALTWTPGSDWIITADSTGPDSPYGLVAISVSSGAKRELLAAPAAGRGFASPLVSSDGSEIAILQGGVAHTASTLLLGTLDGSLRVTTQPRRLPMEFPWVDSLTWGPGNRGVLVSVASTLDGQRVLQFYPTNSKAPEALPGVGSDAVEPDYLRSTGRLIFTRLDSRKSSIWSFSPDARPALPRQLSASTSSNMDADASPDGTWVAFRSLRSGKPAIWISRTDGSALRQLADIGAESYGNPRWSPDGRRIAFHARLQGKSQLYIGATDGKNPIRTGDPAANSIFPTWSRDGKSLYFRSDRDGHPRIWRIELSAQRSEPLLEFDALYAIEDETGDGLYVAETGRPPALTHVNLRTRVRRPVFLGIASPTAIATSRRGVYFLTAPDPAGRSELRFLPRGASTSITLRRIERPVDSGLGVSEDGSVVIYSQVDQEESTLVLVEGVK